MLFFVVSSLIKIVNSIYYYPDVFTLVFTLVLMSISTVIYTYLLLIHVQSYRRESIIYVMRRGRKPPRIYTIPLYFVDRQLYREIHSCILLKVEEGNDIVNLEVVPQGLIGDNGECTGAIPHDTEIYLPFKTEEYAVEFKMSSGIWG